MAQKTRMLAQGFVIDVVVVGSGILDGRFEDADVVEGILLIR